MPTAENPNAGTKVLTLASALWHVAIFKRQAADFLFAAAQSAQHGGFWTLTRGGLAYPWSVDDAFALAGYVLEARFNYLDEMGSWTGKILTASEPDRIWFQDASGGAFHLHEQALLDGLRNNLEASCLGQNKARLKGIFRTKKPGSKNPMRIRVPHL